MVVIEVFAKGLRAEIAADAHAGADEDRYVVTQPHSEPHGKAEPTRWLQAGRDDAHAQERTSHCIRLSIAMRRLVDTIADSHRRAGVSQREPDAWEKCHGNRPVRAVLQIAAPELESETTVNHRSYPLSTGIMTTWMLSYEEVLAAHRPVVGPTGDLPDSGDVVIVGAGPVGLAAANLLGAYGVQTLLVEQNALTSDQPKAVIVDDEHMRLIDRMGLLEAARDHLASTYFGIHFYSPLGFELVKADGFVTPNGFGNRNSVSQPMLEQLLLKGTQRYPHIVVRFDCRLVELAQQADGVDLTLRNHDGAMTRVCAKFVLACDGANSFVRKALGIAAEGKRIDEPHLVVDFAEFSDQSPYSRFFCNPTRPFNSILVPYGGRRIEFMLNPGAVQGHRG
jgi:hypothetical protein